MAGVLAVLAVWILRSPPAGLRASEANAGDEPAGETHRSVLELSALAAWRDLPVLLCGRGSAGRRCDRHLRQELRHSERAGHLLHRVNARGDASGLSDRPRDDSEIPLATTRPRHIRRARHRVQHRRLSDQRLCLGRIRRRARPGQRADVAGHLSARDRGPRPLHRKRFSAADHGHFRRCGRPASVRPVQGRLRLPARVLRARGAVLFVYSFYSIKGYAVGRNATPVLAAANR